MLATYLALCVVLTTLDSTLSLPYIINGDSPAPGTPPSPAVYMCQDQCSQNCAPMCTPSCCGAKTDQTVTANAYPNTQTNNNQLARPNWNNDVVHNTPVARDASASCAGKTPEMMIHSIEEGETEECNSEKGFHSPTDNSEDPPGTITIPLPDTLYTPPKLGDGMSELPLPTFHIPADIMNGKFPKESLKLEPIAAGSPNAVPVVVGGTAGSTTATGQVLQTNVGQQVASAVTPVAPAMVAAPAPPPPPPLSPPPATPSYPVYPKLPPVTISEIPKKKIPVAGVPLVHPPVPLLNRPAALAPAALAPAALAPAALTPATPLTTTAAAVSNLVNKPFALPNAAAAIQTPNMVTPAATKASVCEPDCPINIESGNPSDDEKEYESMIRDMKSQFDARFPQVPKKRTRMKSSRGFKKSKMSKRHGKAKKAKAEK